MIGWIREYHEVLSLTADLAMLSVWGIYLHVFLIRYRRQTRAKIVINAGAGTGLDAQCFISNMSSEFIYVEAIIVCMQAGPERWCCHVTDFRKGDVDGSEQDSAMTTHQGPLRPGASIHVGTFGQLARRISQSVSEAHIPDLESSGDSFALEVQVIADYASEDLLIGARRRFQVACQRGDILLNPEKALTHQIRSGRERRKYQKQLRSSAQSYDRAL